MELFRNIESNITNEDVLQYNNTGFDVITSINSSANITKFNSTIDYRVAAGVAIVSFILGILFSILGIVGLNFYQRKRASRCNKNRKSGKKRRYYTKINLLSTYSFS